MPKSLYSFRILSIININFSEEADLAKKIKSGCFIESIESYSAKWLK